MMKRSNLMEQKNYKQRTINNKRKKEERKTVRNDFK